jgi:thiol-disulfide isomerase/thioredoxin
MDSGALVMVVAVAAATAFGLMRARTDGKVNLHLPGHHVTPGELGHEMGENATLLQFSSPFCQPCKVTHDMLARTQAGHPGVTHVDLQVADHLDMVNRLHVLRTPTTVLLDRKGAVRYRAEGVPREDELLAALDRTLAH